MFESVNYQPIGVEDDEAKITIGEHTLSNKIEQEHFLVQLFRIPKLANFELPFVKLMQLAYNAGQLQAKLDTNAYEADVTSFINQNNLINIDTYISNPDDLLEAKTGSCESCQSIWLMACFILMLLCVIYYFTRSIAEALSNLTRTTK